RSPRRWNADVLFLGLCIRSPHSAAQAAQKEPPMTHLDRKNSSLSFTGASWLGLLLFGAAACDDAAQPERTPGGVLQPVHHDVDATDSDDVSHESGTGDSGVAALEP